MNKVKIYIIGSTGTGKSTLAAKLSAKLNVPRYDLDEIHWLPDWKEKPTTQFVEEVREIISEECNSKTGWIFCGNYTPVQTMLMDNCDYILWLDYPIWRLVLPRLLYRTFRRVFFNEPCCNGNYETFYLACCTRFSIVYWLFQSYWKIQDKYNNMMSMTSENVNKQKFIKLKSDQDTEDFVCNTFQCGYDIGR